MLIVALLLIPLAAHSACPAPDPVYRVKPNGTHTTRPAYTLQGTTLIKSKVRAPVGATCDLTKPHKRTATAIYAQWGMDGTVALCSKSK